MCGLARTHVIISERPMASTLGESLLLGHVGVPIMLSKCLFLLACCDLAEAWMHAGTLIDCTPFSGCHEALSQRLQSCNTGGRQVRGGACTSFVCLMPPHQLLLSLLLQFQGCCWIHWPQTTPTNSSGCLSLLCAGTSTLRIASPAQEVRQFDPSSVTLALECQAA